ncbi:MAG: hypothetical protein P1U87_19800 [Verrucomicrobiales bacterium]|nr:hypothetical protein [Verrucomicrobiales bacterium]
MKTKLLVLIAAVLSSASFAYGQVGQQMALLNSPAYEAAAAPLRGAPPRQYNFSKAVLSDVMRLMAEDAGIGFFGLPDGSNGGERLVTFTIKASAFVALETLAKANGVALIHDSGIWYLRPANDNELIGRIYEINYNAQELVTKNTQASGGVGGSSSGGSGAGGAAAGLDLQGSPDFFVTEPSRILSDIQNILDIPTTGARATFAPTASVDNVAQLSLGGLQGAPDVVSRAVSSGDADSGAGQSKVIWNSDSNTLYVVATRQQHQWIEAYLASADRPQPMIAVEVKFIETSRNPTSDFGIDWDGALGDSGLEVNLNNATGPINLDSIGSYSLPTAVLSYSDLNWKLRAIYGDRNTKSVSFPRMVTLDNREVAFRSVINQPVLGSSASASLGAGGTQTSSIEYIPIGTVINILPKRMKDDKILLNVSVTVSDIVGTEFINGNPFPIATSRVYTAPLTVKSGYTVAISGLDAASTSVNERGVPGLAKIPVLGYAFKNKKKDRNRQHLMMLITPIALDPGTEGLTKKPVISEPWKQHAYAKAPVADAAPRTNADLYPNPIQEVPDFQTKLDPVESRKASHQFGGKPQLVATPMEAEVTPRNVGASAAIPMTEASKPVAPSSTPVAVDSTVVALQPMASEPKGAAKPEVKPAPASVDPPEPAMDDEKFAGIKSGIAKIEEQLSRVPAGTGKLEADDGQLVVNAFESAQKLLNEVDEVRGSDGAPLQGELGDAWWQLISLKTKAVKISRRSPDSLALNLDGDSSEETAE